MIIVCLDMYVKEHYPRLKTNAVSWYGRPRIPKRGLNNLHWTNIENFGTVNVTIVMLSWAKIILPSMEIGNSGNIVMMEENSNKILDFVTLYKFVNDQKCGSFCFYSSFLGNEKKLKKIWFKTWKICQGFVSFLAGDLSDFLGRPTLVAFQSFRKTRGRIVTSKIWRQSRRTMLLTSWRDCLINVLEGRSKDQFE